MAVYYPQEVIEQVRLGNDIVEVIGAYTRLAQRGGSYVGLCPFHREKTPSFSVSADKQLYHCFGCGASGNVISFIMQIENYDFGDAVKFLAEKIRYELPQNGYMYNVEKQKEKESLFKIHKISARHYYDNLNAEIGVLARAYLDKRKLALSVRKKYGIGYSADAYDDLYSFLKHKGYDDEILLKSGLVLKNKYGKLYDRFHNRIMFPIIDVHSRIIAFGGRTIEEGEKAKKTAKYLNSPETVLFSKSDNLYSLNFARQAKTRKLILVEGYMDVISLYQAGIHNAVAALGTAFNERHSRLLKKYADSVILLFDSDEAGVKAVMRAAPALISGGIGVKVLQVRDAKDPDEYIKTFGVESFNSLLDEAMSFTSFKIANERKKYDFSDTTQVIEFTKSSASMLAELDNVIEREAYMKQTAVMTGISYDSILTETEKILKNQVFGIKSKKFEKITYKIDKNSIDAARKGIIALTAANNLVYDAVHDYIQPAELVEEIYVRLLTAIFGACAKGRAVYPAELVSMFEEPEQQQAASDIFMLQTKYDDSELAEKAVNDYVKVIKKAYIDFCISEISADGDGAEESVKRIQELLVEKRRADSLNIKLYKG